MAGVETELKKLLNGLGVHPSKAMGQNFLIDPEVAKGIVAALRPAPDDVVIEIGPGTGALSEHLVGKVRRLVLVEFDRKLAAYLRDKYADDPSVDVHEGDATEFDLRPYFAEGTVKAIGNLPYSCGGEILRRFLDPPTPISDAVFMLQKEVAHRLMADPRSKAYGRMTLMIGVGWKVEPLTSLSPEPFFPKPAVDSSVIRVTRREPGEIAPFDRRVFDRLLRSGFAQRRKQLKRRLPLEGKSWDDVCEELDLSPTARAEELSLDDWLRLARHVDPHPLKNIPQSADEMFDVVDQDDVVTGQRSRAEVHAEKLLHRAVHVFVFNRNGELFLQKRSLLKDTAPGLWDSSSSGHLDVGESYAEGAKRELAEELGVEVDPHEIAKIDPCEDTGWEFVSLFRAEHRGPFRWPCSEIETGEFFSEAVIADWLERRPGDFASGFRECWRRFRG